MHRHKQLLDAAAEALGGTVLGLGVGALLVRQSQAYSQEACTTYESELLNDVAERHLLVQLLSQLQL